VLEKNRTDVCHHLLSIKLQKVIIFKLHLSLFGFSLKLSLSKLLNFLFLVQWIRLLDHAVIELEDWRRCLLFGKRKNIFAIENFLSSGELLCLLLRKRFLLLFEFCTVKVLLERLGAVVNGFSFALPS
jgi:hypothetical protein